MTGHSTLELRTATDTLHFDAESGHLAALDSRFAPGHNLIAATTDSPVFVLQYLDTQRRFRQLSAANATAIDVVHTPSDDGAESLLVVTYRRLAALDLDVTMTVRTSFSDRFSAWSLRIRNNADLEITDVQFPFIVLPYRLAGTPDSEELVWPLGAGVVMKHPQPQRLAPDCPHTWQMRPENGDSLHYPGFTIAQFLAYGDDRAGVYIACRDTAGYIKQIKPVHHAPGLRLGIAHTGDWLVQGERELPYDVVVGSYSGDWYAAAGLYRDWSLQQPWARTPLHARTDVPSWLLASPPHIILRIQGELDLGPAEPNEEFLPYAKMIPLLEQIARRIEAPLVPVIMSWERPGPWIYPDCFPPAGGFEALREFTVLARERGWHIGTFCNGTRWVTGHFWSGYDGEDYFNEQNGAASVCRTHTHDLWHETWDATWRPSYASCIGTQQTRDIAVDFVRTLLDTGLDWIQFFDQNIGCSTFPCFAADHEHTPVPGRWMTKGMSTLIDSFYELDAPDRSIAFSVEGPVTEYFIPRFQICDIRVVPPGHKPDHALWTSFAPLYHFLYHEFLLIQGGFGYGPAPYHLPIRNAYNLVVGEIPGAVMKGDGTLLNMDTSNWAPWEPVVGSNEDALRMLHAATALRRGVAQDFLVYGRMLAPTPIADIPTINWQEDGIDHQIPAIFHAAWQAPDGRAALVLANWTSEPREVIIRDPRLAGAVSEHSSTGTVTTRQHEAAEHLTVTIPPLGCTLIAAA